MAQVLLFHHVQGLTPGVHAFAELLRGAGHTVHTPDLFDGQRFATIPEGIAHAQSMGFGNIIERGCSVADTLPSELVYAGFSMGVMPAQKLAQTRAGARGALLLCSCAPLSAFGGLWPSDLPVQIHGMDGDFYFVDEGDIEAARELVASAKQAELFLYPGKAHLFADASLPDYDAAGAALLAERVLAFLASVSCGSERA